MNVFTLNCYTIHCMQNLKIIGIQLIQVRELRITNEVYCDFQLPYGKKHWR